MRIEDIETAKKFIMETALLSSVERAEWLQLLSEMNDKQIFELINILKPREPKISPAAFFSQVDIKEKELTAGTREHELNLPPPLPQLSRPQPPLQPQPQSQQPSRPQRPLQQQSQQQQPPQQPLQPRQVPQTQPPPAPSPRPATEPRQSPDPITTTASLNTAEDFAGLTAGALHNSNPQDFFANALNLVTKLAKKQQSFAAITNFKQSPLYRTYIDFGAALLRDPNTDRDQLYLKLVKDAKFQKSPFLDKQEFEATADFMKELDRLFI